MNGTHPGTPVVVGEIEIEPIERCIVRVEDVGGWIVGVALKEPIAVVIRTPAGTTKVDLGTATPPMWVVSGPGD